MSAAVASVALLSQIPLGAQALDPWATVDDFQAVEGLNSIGAAIGTDATGTILFTVGQAVTAGDGSASAIINRSTDAGATWEVVDRFSLQTGANGAYGAFTVDGSTETLYAGGGISDGTAGHWIVRQSDDVGSNWRTVDDFQYAPGTASACTDLAADGGGVVYGVGTARNADRATGLWVVRRSVNGGPWTTREVLGGSTSIGSYLGARAVAVHPAGGVLVVGALPQTYQVKRRKTGTQASWTVRRSLDGGVSWTTVDTYQPNNAYPSRAEAIAVDSLGNIYVVGFAAQSWVVRKSSGGGAPNTWITLETAMHYAGAYSVTTVMRADHLPDDVFVAGYALENPSNVAHWLVRMAEAGGSSFTFSDDYLLDPGESAGAHGIAHDATGNLLVTGYGREATATHSAHWITRKLAAP